MIRPTRSQSGVINFEKKIKPLDLFKVTFLQLAHLVG